jgi:hypothetical protein
MTRSANRIVRSFNWLASSFGMTLQNCSRHAAQIAQ